MSDLKPGACQQRGSSGTGLRSSGKKPESARGDEVGDTPDPKTERAEREAVSHTCAPV